MVAFGVASAPIQYSDVFIMPGKNELNDNSCIGEGLEQLLHLLAASKTLSYTEIFNLPTPKVEGVTRRTRHGRQPPKRHLVRLQPPRLKLPRHPPPRL